MYPGPDSNRHGGLTSQEILSLSRLPIPPPGQWQAKKIKLLILNNNDKGIVFLPANVTVSIADLRFPENLKLLYGHKTSR